MSYDGPVPDPTFWPDEDPVANNGRRTARIFAFVVSAAVALVLTAYAVARVVDPGPELRGVATFETHDSNSVGDVATTLGQPAPATGIQADTLAGAIANRLTGFLTGVDNRAELSSAIRSWQEELVALASLNPGLVVSVDELNVTEEVQLLPSQQGMTQQGEGRVNAADGLSLSIRRDGRTCTVEIENLGTAAKFRWPMVAPVGLCSGTR